MTPTTTMNAIKKLSDNDEIHSKYKLYGWRNFRISGKLSHPLTAYIILCACNFIQNFSVNGANNAVISTLERVFYLNSVQSGLFLALYDMATVVSSPLVAYLGTLYSSPIFFSLNMIIVGIGNLLIAASQFVSQDSGFNFKPDPILYLSTENNVLFQCYKDSFNEKNITNTSCLKLASLSSASQNSKLLIYFGNFVNGIGSVALFTIGVAYIERIFPRDKAAYCQGIYFAVGTIGSAIGIVVSGRFLQIYTKLVPRQRLPSWLTPSHPLWIGCWWLPYIVYGISCFIISLIVSGLPNYEIPGKKLTIGKVVPPFSSQSNIDSSNLQILRQESAAGISIVSSCSQTPALNKGPPVLRSDSKDQFENSLPALQPLVNEYCVSHPRLRQVSPIKPTSTADVLPNGHDNGGNFINHSHKGKLTCTQSIIPNSVVSSWITTDSKISLISIKTTDDVSSTPTVQKEALLWNLQHICSAILILMKNVRYIFIIIANLFEGILIKGFVPFVTKYFEYQHQLDTSTATLVTGAIALLSVIIGCPLSAYFLNKYSWTPMQCARICGLVFIISSFLFLFLTLSCPELKFEYSSCTTVNSICCQNIYRPVCTLSSPRRMFLSPCHYGCTNQTTYLNSSTNFYSSCNCVDGLTVALSETACRFRQIPCVAIFALALIGAMLVVFFTAFIQVPLLQVLLYSVPLQHQSMALGLRQTVVRAFGQTSGPLLFGYVFDQSCLVWLKDCYGRQTCKVYNNHRMGISMALSGFATRMISGIACLIVFIHWKSTGSDESIIPTHKVTTNTHESVKKNEDDNVTKL